MSRIFISHSSKDNGAAIALTDWLRENGWEDVFLDVDRQQGIQAGERWERRLHESANRCEAIIFLVSKNWLESSWCAKEFDLAQRLSKRMFGVLIDDQTISDLPPRFTSTWQFTDLFSGTDHELFRAIIPPDDREENLTFSRKGLEQLKAGLSKAGLDPRYFEWPPKGELDRAPYRGLSPMDAADAGIFFGREAPLVEAMDLLRGLSNRGAPRIFVVLGASGAGKSSFLRAGLLPRLVRDDRSFCVLPVIRPSRDVLSGETGLVEVIFKALGAAGMPEKRSTLRTLTSNPDAVVECLSRLAASKRVSEMPGEERSRSPTIVLSVDQSEELFQADGSEESRKFIALLQHLVARDKSATADAEPLRVLVLFTIRTDGYGPLQAAPDLEELSQTTFSLPPMPQGAYETVIEGPARRRTDASKPLHIEPALTAALLDDIESGGARDALPLLAFMLERLFVDHGGDGKLTLEDYEESGRLTGAIEASVAHAFAAADSDSSVPRDPQARLSLLRRGLIPWLAGIDPATNLPRRKVARLSEIPEEARPLICHLIDARLLSINQEEGSEESIVEPAHEALLRQWAVLAGWLKEDQGLLSSLEGVLTATRDWEANVRSDDWLAHTAGRLDDAERLLLRSDMVADQTLQADRRRAEIGNKLGPAERSYLAACRAADDSRRNRELEDAQRIATEATRRARSERFGLVVALVLFMVAAGVGMFAFFQRENAIQNAETSLQNQRNAMVALALTRARADPTDALKLVLAAWPESGEEIYPAISISYEALVAGISATRPNEVLRGHESSVWSVAFSPDGTRIVSGDLDGMLRQWDAVSGEALSAPMGGHEGAVWGVAFSPDGTRIVSVGQDGTLRQWDAVSGDALSTLRRGYQGLFSIVAISPDGTRIVSGRLDGTLALWDAVSGETLSTLRRGYQSLVSSVAFSPDGARIVSGGIDGTLHQWDAVSGEALSVPLRGQQGRVRSMAFSPDGARIVSGSVDGTLYQWDVVTGAPLGAPLRGHEGSVFSVAFSPDGARIISGGLDGTLRLWDAVTGAALGAPLLGQEGESNSVAFSPNGARIVSGGLDGKLRLWDAVTGAALGTPLRGHEGRVTSVAFSPDGTRIVSASSEGTLRLWDAITGTALDALLRGHDGAVWSVAFSPDGARIVSVGQDGALRRWDAVSGKALSTLRRGDYEGWISSAALSSDGTRAVSAGMDGTLHLWDAVSGEALNAPLRGHEGLVSSVALSPDGTRIVTGSFDGTFRLWDAVSGAALSGPLSGHKGPVSDVAFSPDGTRIVSSGSGGTLRLWGNLPRGNILQVACFHLPRINGRPDTSTNGITSNLGLTGLTLPEDCDTYDPPLPPLLPR